MRPIVHAGTSRGHWKHPHLRTPCLRGQSARASVLRRRADRAAGRDASLFEGSMYTFIFLWTPALSPRGERLPHGMTFACFMVASMAGARPAALAASGTWQGNRGLACRALCERGCRNSRDAGRREQRVRLGLSLQHSALECRVWCSSCL